MDSQIESIKNWLGSSSVNIFGRPFCGKDTQGEKLVDLLGGELVAGGEILRSHEEDEELQKILATGTIIPSDMYLKILVPYLSQDRFRGRPLILDAVGRAHGEEEIIMKATEESGHPIKAVVYMKLDEEEVWKRFEAAKKLHDRGERDDDKAEILKTRLQKFSDRTLPVIEFYRQKGLLLEIDGSPSKEQVTKNIIETLHSKANS